MRRELTALGRLAGPILITQLGGMLLGLVDTAVVGRVSESALGAVGLGSSIYFTISVLGFGWMLALDPLIAQAVGAGEPNRARRLFWQGIWVALAGTLPLSVLVVVVGTQSSHLGIPPDVAAQVGPYLMARAIGILPFLLLAASRSFLQAHEVTRPLVVGVIVANAVNLPLSWALVFGELGLPRLGAEGAGWASTVATVLQLLVAVVWVRRLWSGPAWFRPAAVEVRKVLRLGTPIGLQLVAEVGSFAVVSFLMGNLGTLALGAHSVTLTCISVSFQTAVALGSAASVRVGHAVGRGDSRGARRSGFVALGVGACTMLIGAALFVTVPRSLARLLTDEVAVIEATVPLFAIASCFQITDGLQAVAAGALRGAGDTRWPLLANLFGHYAVGVPLGAGLAFGLGWGASGLWWGLSAGLTAVAIGLMARFSVLTRSSIQRA